MSGLLRRLRPLLGRLKERLFLPYRTLEEFQRLRKRVNWLDRRLDHVRVGIGRLESRQAAHRAERDLQAQEFKVYSQFGEDGIIQFLTREVEIEREAFVEFGVEAHESNTRFLLMKDDWSGLVLDGDAAKIAQIRDSWYYWLRDLHAVQAFLTRDNINEVFEQHGMTGRIGLLSIDVDGVDYWLWDALEVAEPAIVVVEYNHRFGAEAAVTVPYREDFDRRRAHSSLCYFGASLRALALLGDRKGYALVGCGSAGLNAFFVRRDVLPSTIEPVSVEEGYVQGKFCEFHDEEGRRRRRSNEEVHRLVMSLPLVDVSERYPTPHPEE